jgi:hypothetical protein
MYIFPLLILLVAIFTVVSGTYNTQLNNRPFLYNIYNYTCCDTGDGPNCRARVEKTVTYKGDTYALLKSNALIPGNMGHHIDITKTVVNKERVFIFAERQGFKKPRAPDCNSLDADKWDRIFGPLTPGIDQDVEHAGKGCYQIPQDLIIYLCRSDNKPGVCDGGAFWSPQRRYDTYIRLKDIQPGGRLGKIPQSIAYCIKPKISLAPTGQQLQIPNYQDPGKKNLQLETFWLATATPSADWLSPYCKPAIYLYPEQKTDIHITVAPKGTMTLTIPQYPKEGWKVTAYPDGRIYANNTVFDYLYWEAQIPDSIIEKPTSGYVIPYHEISHRLETLLPLLGLNKKETSQFVEYWTKVLPKSPYYFIGIIPTTNLDTIAPLTITPKPETVLRVSLYFQALENQLHVPPPHLPITIRSGFTAVEWGGIVKTDKNKSFSCVM